VFGSPAYHSVPTKAHISFISNSPGKLQTRRVSVAAIGPTSIVAETPRVLPSHPNTQMVEDSERSRKLITQGLQLLFQCEYLVLVEYIEGIVPIVFVAYQLVLYQLPNIVYAPGGAEGWQSGAIENILLFTALEMCSLLALKVLMESKFAFFPLYQLAYALETQLELVQVDVFIATIVLLPFELAHF
ncbi:hypothetical protein JG687_00010572, partial [Phytophthora cactorum]